jgi:prepilin peptidase CpaA
MTAGPPMTSTSLWAAGALVLFAAVSDIRTRQIPNTLTLGGLFVGLAIQTAIGAVDGGMLGALHNFAYAILGAFACALIPFFAWRKGEMGGGDVKLFASLGALLGLGFGFDVQAMTFVLAVFVLFPIRIARHGAVRPALANLAIGVRNLLRRGPRVPYVDGPKLPPMILAPTIGIAFVICCFTHGVIR